MSEAVKRGAVAILAAPDAVLPPLGGDIAVVRDANPRRRIALMAAAFAGLQPGTIAAVTGTNGKSSTVHFVRHLWSTLGLRAASVGTLGIVSPGFTRGAGLTTPDPVRLHADLATLAREGVTHLAVEASSHGLDQHRLDGLKLSAAGLHQSHARTSRLSPVDGRLLRGQGAAVRAAPAGRRHRRGERRQRSGRPVGRDLRAPRRALLDLRPRAAESFVC